MVLKKLQKKLVGFALKQTRFKEEFQSNLNFLPHFLFNTANMNYPRPFPSEHALLIHLNSCKTIPTKIELAVNRGISTRRPKSPIL